MPNVVLTSLCRVLLTKLDFVSVGLSLGGIYVSLRKTRLPISRLTLYCRLVGHTRWALLGRTSPLLTS